MIRATRDRDWLTVADVLGLHVVLIQRYGGASGVRDPGALEAALFRPQTGYYADVAEMAAARRALIVTVNDRAIAGLTLAP